MIESIQAFLKYSQGIRRRTLAAIEALPPDKIDWAPAEGEFTCGEIIHHIGSIELMNSRVFAGQSFGYPGHESALGTSKAAAIEYLNACQQQATAILQALPDGALLEKQADLTGRPTSAWRFLMASIEHEVHHRSQLDTYLKLMETEPPQLFGVFMEDLPKN
ncbi:DinB family protein [Chloroflexota bacterium]